jgi:hypothetical protein
LFTESFSFLSRNVQQLTEDKLPEEVSLLLDGVAGDTTKIAVLLMMEQHLGRVGLVCSPLHILLCKRNFGGTHPSLWLLPL